jgi:hypothetical protein
MSRTNNEPEYRRRIREKAEKDQQKAETERQKATDNTKQYEIARSIYAGVQEYQRYTNEERSRTQGDRFWEKAGVFGLWLAAAVGIAAIWVGTHDASEQRGMMQRQLGEMKKAGADTRTLADVSQKTLVMSERPWLYINGNIDVTGGNAEHETFKTDVENTGKALATHVTINANIQLLPLLGEYLRGLGTSLSNISCPQPTDSFPPFSHRQRAIPPTKKENIGFDVIVLHNETGHLIQTNRGGPYLVGCIQYNWPATPQTFHTIFLVAVKVTNQRTGAELGFFPRLEMPLSQYKILPTGEISYHDAD